jgi:type VII secretion protein EccB
VNSRRDQVHAHAYVVGRLTSALVHGEPDAPESPMRRTTLGSFGGLMLGSLLVAAFLIWGLISPSDGAVALTPGELVVAKETGSRYIYARGELHPVLNWSSAMLLLSGQPVTKSVAAASLAGVPQGQPLGIPGAPDALPAASAINRGSWLVCAESSGGSPVVALTIGIRAAAAPAPPDSATVVAAPDGSQYLIYHGQRMRLDASWIRDALGLGRAPVVPVSAAWLNAVPAAADLQPVTVAGRGTPGPALGGQPTRIGQVLAEHNIGSSSQFYLAVAGGITPISLAQAAVLLADPATAAAYAGSLVAPVPVSPAAIAGSRMVSQSLPDGTAAGAPAASPRGVTPARGQVPCVDFPGSGRSVPALVYAAPPTGAPPGQGMTGVTASPQSAGLIKVVTGGGALFRPQAAPGTDGSALFLVTDAGVKFPVPSATQVAALGYRAGQAARLPAALAGLLPTGPALNLPAIKGVIG